MMQWWLKCSLNSKRELIRSQSRRSCSTLSTLTCEKLEKPAAIANTPVLNGPRQLSHSLANFHTPLPTFTHTHTLTFTLTSHKKCVFFPQVRRDKKFGTISFKLLLLYFFSVFPTKQNGGNITYLCYIVLFDYIILTTITLAISKGGTGDTGRRWKHQFDAISNEQCIVIQMVLWASSDACQGRNQETRVGGKSSSEMFQHFLTIYQAQ